MADKQAFKIIANAMVVYNEPGGNKIGKIPKGIIFEVEPDSRQEQLGSIWWKHSAGWSIERTVDGATVFLEPVGGAADDASNPATPDDASSPATPDDGTSAAVVVESPAPVQTNQTADLATPAENPLVNALVDDFKGATRKFNLRSKGSVKVRDAPGGEKLTSLTKGDLLQADMETLVEQENFYWFKHLGGWSAIQSVNGDHIFFEPAGPDVYIPGPDGPKVEEMPGYQSLVVRHPVDLDQTNFFQYFGNNSFAYVNGRNFNYHKFAQGLHSGLDYGSNGPDTNVPVYAGVHGTYAETLPDWKGRVWNKQLRVKTKAGYLLIYQHINPKAFSPGQPITPDTVVGTINAAFPNNADHLHWEIRYNNQDWIVNPLQLMKPELVQQITEKFNPKRPGTGASGSKFYYFYQTDSWTKWGTPLDQPIIVRGGTPIDPKSEGA